MARCNIPDSVELRYARATLADEAGANVAVSVRELKAVLRLRPDDPAALNAYGYTLADHHRRLGTARKLIERAYAVAPKNAAILDSLGWVLFRQGHGEQALPYLNAAYLDDRGGDIAAHLGEVLWQLGKRRTEAERIWSEGGRAEVDNQLLKSDAFASARELAMRRMTMRMARAAHAGETMRLSAVLACCAALAACVTTRPPPRLPTAGSWDQRLARLQHADAWQLDGKRGRGGGQARVAGELDLAPGRGGGRGASGGPFRCRCADRQADTAGSVAERRAAQRCGGIASCRTAWGSCCRSTICAFGCWWVPRIRARHFELARNDEDRALKLTQAGWTVVYDRYIPVESGFAPGAHLILTRDDVRVRIVVDHWAGVQ